ncbi:hypothetical protein [Nonlabens ulvanivorans]|uniref:hypothetical protein n=1 Tax=Nonlabens ulvanivorans TaxID=906888 RepID=UPI0037CA7108
MKKEIKILQIENETFSEIQETLIELYTEYNQSETSSDIKDRQLKAYHFHLIRDAIKFVEEYKNQFSNDEIHDKIIQNLTSSI